MKVINKKKCIYICHFNRSFSLLFFLLFLSVCSSNKASMFSQSYKKKKKICVNIERQNNERTRCIHRHRVA